MTPNNAHALASPVWQAVCSRHDLIAQSGVVVWLDGAQVAVFYVPATDQQVYAIDNHDPESGANVMGRAIVGHLKGHLVVAAPLYKQHYALADGHCLENPAQKLKVWAVRLVGDEVQIAV
ncbi:MAG: nitrite reductase small subunit NirD [Pseudomonas sp.]|uniref:nitrite reductase small subunit NirD n=1 Tax=Pseudomonas abieticivorans TaxID=2931382 RepID=UPI0020BDC9E0|nr:nitrite reductase small subunit NirD [Pseudomonas sp. PIA16]MDE1167150.1 nitrite reductase small subunit NirD [Pseudomonas sp.]